MKTVELEMTKWKTFRDNTLIMHMRKTHEIAETMCVNEYYLCKSDTSTTNIAVKTIYKEMRCR
jgi:hypothetical protein